MGLEQRSIRWLVLVDDREQPLCEAKVGRVLSYFTSNVVSPGGQSTVKESSVNLR